MGRTVRLAIGVFCLLRGLMVFSMWLNANTPKSSYKNAFNHPLLFCCISDQPPCKPASACSIRAEERFVLPEDVMRTRPRRIEWIAYGIANTICGVLVVFNKHPVVGALVGVLLTFKLQPEYILPNTLETVTSFQM